MIKIGATGLAPFIFKIGKNTNIENKKNKMEIKTMTKKNDVFIIGELVEVKTDVRISNEGKKYISGKVSVKVVDNGVENIIDVSIFAFEKTKAGADNKLFKAYTTLESLLNKRVRVTGSLGEGSIVDESTGDVRHFNQINGRFINAAYSTDTEDKATFEYSGFVTRPIYERKDKEDNLLGYRIEVAQANYDDTGLFVVRFDINKNDVDKARVIEANYLTGCTVEFSGTLGSTTSVETKTIPADFGEPMVKTFVKTEKTYTIQSGTNPRSEDDEDAYSGEMIKKLVAAYKQADVDRVEKARNTATETVSAPNSAAAAMGAITRSATASLI